MALAVAESKKCKYFDMLSAREKEIVVFMDLVHPVPIDGEKFEEVMDVSAAELFYMTVQLYASCQINCVCSSSM